MEARRRQLTRQSDEVSVFVVRILSLVTISVIIIEFAAARETTAIIVADASRGPQAVGRCYSVISLVNYSYLRARLGDRAACFSNRTSWWKRKDDT